MLPLTPAFNEVIIMGTIDILQTFAEPIDLTEEMVDKKVIMMRSEVFTINNVI